LPGAENNFEVAAGKRADPKLRNNRFIRFGMKGIVDLGWHVGDSHAAGCVSRKSLVARIDFGIAFAECEPHKNNRNRMPARGFKGSLERKQYFRIFGKMRYNIILHIHDQQGALIVMTFHSGTKPFGAAESALKKNLGLFIRFREKKAQLLTGVEESPSTNPLRSRIQSPLFNELHQLFVELFDEMKVNELTPLNSVFRADMLLTALSRDSYSFQRDVRGYSPEMILEQLCALFISLE
jgi:hypothetical protein